MKSILNLILILALLNSCNEDNSIEGLWIVKSVAAGENEMTPNARWVRFNTDLTQQSGNGWLQHSYGTWELDSETNELSIVNENGINDSNEPFKIILSDDEMVWNRVEEGQDVTINLEKSNDLPLTFGDRLLGLWELEEATGNGNYFKHSEISISNYYIFFKWDKRFFIESDLGKFNGVYNVNGHRPEVELIPDEAPFKSNFWQVNFDRNNIILSLTGSDSIVTRKFKRIHEFPQ